MCSSKDLTTGKESEFGKERMTTGKETESYGTNFMPAIQGTNFNTIKSQTRVILDVHMNIELASDGLWKVLWAKVGRDGHWAKSNLKKKLIWMPKSTNNPKPISSSKPNTTQTQNKPLPQPSYTKPTSNKPNSSQLAIPPSPPTSQPHIKSKTTNTTQIHPKQQTHSALFPTFLTSKPQTQPRFYHTPVLHPFSNLFQINPRLITWCRPYPLFTSGGDHGS